MLIVFRYCTQEIKASPEVSQTFYLLLDLMTFFDYFHSQQYNDALDVIHLLLSQELYI